MVFHAQQVRSCQLPLIFPPKNRRAPKGMRRWLGRRGSNSRMRESKSRALPLGYTPSQQAFAASAATLSREERENSGTRTHDIQSHNLALYQLNYILHMRAWRVSNPRPTA